MVKNFLEFLHYSLVLNKYDSIKDGTKFKMLQRVQFKDVSLNPFKTVRSLGSGMRMIYDANMEAIMRESMCQEWLQISC